MSTQTPDRPPVLVPLLGLVLLVFLVGAAVVQFRLPPYPQLLEPAFLALEARLERARVTGGDPTLLEGQLHWRVARTGERGVTVRRPEAMWGDYTLYTSTDSSAAYLVDGEGARVHRWHVPFREAFPEAPHLENPVAEEDIFWSNGIVFPDGSLLTRYGARGDTPYGYGLIKIDADSRVLWTFAGTSHHDVQVDVEADSTLLTLTHEFRRPTGVPELRDILLDAQVLDDFVVRLSPEGEVLQRVSLMEAFARSPFRWVLESTFLADEALPRWDVLHANGVRPVPAWWAEHHEWAEPGQWLVSLRSPSLLALVDPEAEEVVWMSRSFWRFQHDPHFVEGGRLILFDNQGHGGVGDRSRILELDPATGALSWSYAGTSQDPFYSEYSSHLQVLGNGNVLVTSSNAGRLFEVTREGEIVWEFWNPHRTTADGREYIASVADAKRYRAEDLPFLAR